MIRAASDSGSRYMNIQRNEKGWGFKLSFIINTIIGSVALALMIVAFVAETVFPSLRGQIGWGFLSTVIICYFIASLHYAKYLNLQK